jgi:hypothetical protein
VLQRFQTALKLVVSTFQRRHLLCQFHQALVLNDPLDGLHTPLQLVDFGRDRVIDDRLQ